MKRKLIVVLVPATFLLVVGGFLVWPKSTVPPVSVVFLGYTNADTSGLNNQYTWAWFRLENHGPVPLSCRQGPLAIEQGGAWGENRDRLGFSYDPNIEPGKALTISVIPPSQGTRWRSGFLFTPMRIHSRGYWTTRIRFQMFIDSLRLQRFGIRWRPWKLEGPPAYLVTSETMKL